MSCFIIGAGSFYGLPVPIQPTDTVIAADGGWEVCRALHITPTLLVADFDSLTTPPDFDHTLRLPVEKDDTDMLRAVKEGFARGEADFRLLGGMGGSRTDHTRGEYADPCLHRPPRRAGLALRRRRTLHRHLRRGRADAPRP